MEEMRNDPYYQQQLDEELRDMEDDRTSFWREWEEIKYDDKLQYEREHPDEPYIW